MATVRLSKRFSLQISDAWRSAFMAIVSPLIVYVYDWASGDHDLDFKLLVKMAIASGAAYLLKNFAVEPAKTIVTTDTNAKAVNANQKIKDAL